MKKQKQIYRWTFSFLMTLGAMLLVQRGESLQILSLPIDQPTVLTAVSPVFPPTAVATNTSGTVSIEVGVNAAGEVTSARSINGHPLLRKAAENTARRWRFTPSSNARVVNLLFVFRIVPKETAIDELTPVFTPPYQVEVRHHPYEPIVHSDPKSDERSSQRSKKKPEQ